MANRNGCKVKSQWPFETTVFPKNFGYNPALRQKI